MTRVASVVRRSGSGVARRFAAVLCAVGALGQTAGARGDGETFAARLVAAAIERTSHRVHYEPGYRRIPYPGGDVPPHTGVCTDVVIRTYRAVGIDLQKEVHEDMRARFAAYPKLWGLARPDPNIDHRRVPNLATFFRRKGAELPVSRDPLDYRPGDLVTWVVPPHRPHIGIVTDRRSPTGTRPLIVHNIGLGPVLEDMLFDYPISGHFRYAGSGSESGPR